MLEGRKQSPCPRAARCKDGNCAQIGGQKHKCSLVHRNRGFTLGTGTMTGAPLELCE